MAHKLTKKNDIIDKILSKQSKYGDNRDGCNESWLGDGYCDSDCNNSENDFDEGDCCPGENCTNPCHENNIWTSYFLDTGGQCECGSCYMYPNNTNEFDHGKCCCNNTNVV